MGIMEGRDAKHIRARFEDIYSPALLANWKIWPAAQVRRQLYVSCFGIY
jgi:protein Mpv17